MGNNESHFSSKDREMLIRIDEKVRNTQDEVKGIYQKISDLDARKFDLKEAMEWRKDADVGYQDHENRMRKVESIQDNQKGAFAMVQIGWGVAVTIVSLILSHYWQ